MLKKFVKMLWLIKKVLTYYMNGPQGWRISMEDAHTHILTLAEDKDAAFFAVYDGHGGAKIASHVSKHLHKTLVRRPEYKQGNYEEAFVKSFLECDEAMRKDETLKDEMSGSTAITALYRYVMSQIFFFISSPQKIVVCTYM